MSLLAELVFHVEEDVLSLCWLFLAMPIGHFDEKRFQYTLANLIIFINGIIPEFPGFTGMNIPSFIGPASLISAARNRHK